ncbi:MAG TPA: hypothetical protein VNM22_00075 [Candidatus Limnocylindrales bacterium]|nr:hypothetical protein [Candidatus Limnocylindrales bacterium]
MEERDERLCKILEQFTEMEQNILWLALGSYLKSAPDLEENDRIIIQRMMASLMEIEKDTEETNP